MELFEWLNDFRVVHRYDVLTFRQTDASIYYKITIEIADGSILYASEYLDKTSRSYSFHWQQADGALLQRWDNAPHFKKLDSFPHHVHTGPDNVVLESHDISLSEVLAAIFSSLTS